MTSSYRKGPRAQQHWERLHLPDYAPLSAALPLREADLVQTGSGRFDVSSRVVDAGDVAACHTVTSVPSVGIIVEHARQLMFFIPRRWSGELKANGEIVRKNQFHFADGEHSVYIAGQERDMLGVIVPRGQFTRTVAALQGLPFEEVKQPRGSRGLSPESFDRMQKALMTAVYQGAHKTDGHSWNAGRFSESVFGAVLEACLSTDIRQQAAAGAFRKTARIVKSVEELFERAGPKPLSLADLCLAAGVSSSTLYRAFHSYCDLPPLDYLHKRRLTAAHSKLVAAKPGRGVIKRAALDEGLTELGRFSVEYRRLFGESPRYTLLNQSL